MAAKKKLEKPGNSKGSVSVSKVKKTKPKAVLTKPSSAGQKIKSPKNSIHKKKKSNAGTRGTRTKPQPGGPSTGTKDSQPGNVQKADIRTILLPLKKFGSWVGKGISILSKRANQDLTATVAIHVINLLEREVEKRLSKRTSSELVNSRLILLDRDSQLAYIQAAKSFRNATVASFLGLGVLMAGIAMVFKGVSTDITIITTLSGAIVELVSALFLNLYAKSLTQHTYFHNQTDAALRIFYANEIAGEVSAGDKSRTKVSIIDHLLGDQDQSAEEFQAALKELTDTKMKKEGGAEVESIRHDPPAILIQSFIVLAIYMMLSILSWNDLIPFAFLPIVVTVLGLGVFTTSDFMIHKKENSVFLQLVAMVVNSLFLAFSFWRLSERVEIGLYAFFIALLVHIGWVLFLGVHTSAKRLMVALVVIAMVVFLLDRVFLYGFLSSQLEGSFSTVRESLFSDPPSSEMKSKQYSSTATETTLCYSFTSTESEIVARIPEGERYTILGENSRGDWIFIQWNTIDCWINATINFLPIVPTPVLPSATPSITPSPTTTFIIMPIPNTDQSPTKIK